MMTPTTDEADFHYRFESFDLSGGDTVDLSPEGVLIIVGPNNSGKSRLLRELRGLWQGAHSSVSQGQRKVVQGVELDRTESRDSFINWLKSEYETTDTGAGLNISTGETAFYSKNAQIPGLDWIRVDPIASTVVKLLDAESRLTLSRQVKRVDPYNDRHEHFIHSFQVNETKFNAAKKEVRKAFGLDMVVDNFGATTTQLYVGSEPELGPGQSVLSEPYVRSIREQMVPLEEAGDGVRSFVVTASVVLSGAQPVLLVDEPEAFLHPPQARLLGSLLARVSVERRRQVIVATHSADVVRGALSSSHPVSVCRVERVPTGPTTYVNRGHLLDADDVRSLWEKPLLRSSGAIDGLFHKGVVVCEADSDARFYESLLARIDRSKGASSDVHFVHGAGKSELAPLARSYTTLGVPVAVVADFDLLRNRDELAAVSEAVGLDFASIRADYVVASSALADVAPTRSTQETIGAIELVLAEVKSEAKVQKAPSFTGPQRRAIVDALIDAKPWSEAKRYGIDKLSGEQHKACDSLLNRLEEAGVFVVRKGELESWDRSLTRNKSKWIVEALTKLDEKGGFANATDFIRRVREYLNPSPITPNTAEEKTSVDEVADVTRT